MLCLDIIDRETLTEALLGIASEGILQGSLNVRDKRPIDNDAIRERIVEALILFEAELRVAGIRQPEKT